MGFRGSPTLDTLVAFAVVFAVQQLTVVFELALGLGQLWQTLFVLGSPVTVRPWTLFTSVYAHAGVGHLLSNAVALVLVGFVLERYTTRARFHAFFVATGALAGLSQVWLGGFLNGLTGGPAVGSAVLGASGAVLALYGYVLGGNRLTTAVADRLDAGASVEWALALLVAAVLTWMTASPGVAIIAHFTGVLLGLAAGRLDLLATPPSTKADGRNATYK
ncbi:rhomboid family intramembrane serine protease [Halorubellus sp. JP-L1]|uniref:rhomboid family intramembrane serine protease n=1 Tax=Halorubellus sp. JP-L1 TaxID=2715753 RepID=UPI00140E6490|nr:rhomboid family intramembrane serine protease [Halorubellus sp. JP-L1]NHN42080.1 rhomboid family intramembrane serine protease [Halorubellus sp. JP-L1]